MKTIDRDLDLLVRHEAAPRLGADHGDVVLLARPPTRILIAVDPEKKYATRAKQKAERDKLVRRLHEMLPSQMRSQRALKQIGALGPGHHLGTVPWEFANFTDAELATAITKSVSLPSGQTRRDLIAALKAERAVGKTNPGRSQMRKQYARHGRTSSARRSSPKNCGPSFRPRFSATSPPASGSGSPAARSPAARSTWPWRSAAAASPCASGSAVATGCRMPEESNRACPDPQS